MQKAQAKVAHRKFSRSSKVTVFSSYDIIFKQYTCYITYKLTLKLIREMFIDIQNAYSTLCKRLKTHDIYVIGNNFNQQFFSFIKYSKLIFQIFYFS